MATIKSYTDIEQSKKLAEILPIESSDGYWDFQIDGYNLIADKLGYYKNDSEIPCWSLASLLDIMICPNLEEYIEGVWDLTAFTDNTLKTPIEIQDCKEPVDACVAMIERLHKLNLL